LSGVIGERIFGRTIDCSCGRAHRIEPDEVIYAEDAPRRLAAAAGGLAAGRRVAVLMDARTREAAGARVSEAFARAGRRVQEIIVADSPGGGGPVCDDLTKDALAGRIGAADMFVSVGSGVITDLGKWLAFDAGAAFVSFATAASMNGYTSANVAPNVRGLKTLIRARPAIAVAADPSVIRDAPFELTSAGLGDVLARSVSSADWMLNHLLFGDEYCDAAVGLIAEIEPLYLNDPTDLRARRQQAVDALFEALLLGGAAMTMAGTSAPASGAEHLISHSLDMMSSLDGRPHDLHGRQVGVGTIIAAELYRRVLQQDSPDWRDAPVEVDRRFWGPLSGPVGEAYARKLPRLAAARRQLARDGVWRHVRRRLSPMLRPPEQIRRCLAGAGAAWAAEQIRCDPPRLLAAFRHAHEIRPRFTILDLAHLAGVMPHQARDIVDRWACAERR